MTSREKLSIVTPRVDKQACGKQSILAILSPKEDSHSNTAGVPGAPGSVANHLFSEKSIANHHGRVLFTPTAHQSGTPAARVGQKSSRRPYLTEKSGEPAAKIQKIGKNFSQKSSGGRPSILSPALPSSATSTITSSPSKMKSSKISGMVRPKSANYSARRCRVKDCTSMARSRGLCTAHGGGKKCSADGCTNIAQSRGLCRSHGGGSRCQVSDCTRSAQSRGLCRTHGGGQICKFPSCTSSVVSGGLCRAHGGGRTCQFKGCSNVAQCLGMCRAHGNARKAQRKNGMHGVSLSVAMSTAAAKGIPAQKVLEAALPPLRDAAPKIILTDDPSVKAKKAAMKKAALANSSRLCKEDGCGRCARSGGKCIAHGGGKRCKVDGCWRSVQILGYCKTHCSNRKSSGKVTDRELPVLSPLEVDGEIGEEMLDDEGEPYEDDKFAKWGKVMMEVETTRGAMDRLQILCAVAHAA